MSENQPKPGDLCMLGEAFMRECHIGWTAGDGSSHEGYNVGDYFDSLNRYKGPDEHGIEPIFREMTVEECAEYLKEGLEWPLDK